MQAMGSAIGGLFSFGAANSAMKAAKNAMPNGPGPAPTFDIIAGQEQQQAYDAEAQMLGQESTFALQDAAFEAAQNNYAGAKFQANQNAAFGASGVTLAGSPLGILTETSQLTKQESNFIMQKGQLQSQLLEEQGLQMLRQGSAAAFAGQAGALTDQFNYESQRAQAMASLAGAKASATGSLFSGLASAGGLAASSLFGSGGGGGGSFFGNLFGGGGGGYPSPGMVP